MTPLAPGNGLRIQTRWVSALGLSVAILAAACTDPAVRKQRYFESGNRYFDQANYPAAIIEYRNAIKLDATFGEARKQLAEAYSRTGDTRGALEESVRAADLLPADVEVQLRAGNLLLAARKSAEAMDRADAVLKIQPENVDALVIRGTALAGLSSFDEALKAIEQAIELAPDRGATYANLGLVELARGRRDEAEKALLRAVALSPQEVRSRLALGNFYWAVGRPSDAEQAFDAALKLEPTNTLANRFMAFLMFSTGRRGEAEPYLHRLADSLPTLEGTLVLVDYYLATARPKDAIARLNALTSGQTMPGVLLRLARAHAASGDRTKALSVVEQILKANGKDAAAHLLKGRLLLQDGRRDKAFEAIRAASVADPSLADAQFALGQMYAARGDNAAAQAAFREALRINPRAAAAQVALARLGSQSNPEEAVRTAEEATRNDPTSPAARLELVRSLIAARDSSRADREMTRLRADYPNVSAVHALDSRLALLKNDMAGARAALERAEKLDPGSLEVLALAISIDFRQKDTTRARTRIEERLKQGASPELLLLAGTTYRTLKDLPAAERALRAAIDADPSRNEPYALLGSIYLNQKKLDEALREFEALSTKQQKPVGPLTMVGMILEQQGKRDLAKKRYEQVLALDSRAGTAANNLAWLLADAGEDLDRALQLAQTAVAVAPDTPQITDTLGWVYYKRGLPLLAIPQFEKSIRREPTNGWYHYHLGLAHLQAGDTVRGRAALALALKYGTNSSTGAEIRRTIGEVSATP